MFEWFKEVATVDRLSYITRTDDLIKAAGLGLGSNPHGGNLCKLLSAVNASLERHYMTHLD